MGDEICVAYDHESPYFRPLKDVVADVKAGRVIVPLASNTHPDIRTALADSRRKVRPHLPIEFNVHVGFHPERTGTRGR